MIQASGAPNWGTAHRQVAQAPHVCCECPAPRHVAKRHLFVAQGSAPPAWHLRGMLAAASHMPLQNSAVHSENTHSA